MKISKGANPLDNTSIHPESYNAAEKLLKMASVSIADISKAGEAIRHYVDKNGSIKSAEELGIGEPTLLDIVENLLKPGRDPREEMPKPISFKQIARVMRSLMLHSKCYPNLFPKCLYLVLNSKYLFIHRE